MIITRLLAKIPWALLLPVAIGLGLAPFRPEPHLVEKLHMLADGQLTRPLDVFDLLMHGAPLALIVGKLLAERATPTGKKHL